MSSDSDAALQARFLEKVASRKDGRAVVIETIPEIDTRGTSPEAIDARYEAKRARHGKQAPKPDAQAEQKATKVEPVSDKPADETKKPDAQTEQKRRG